MPSLGWSLFLLAWIQAQATLDQRGHAMLITYDIQQPSRAQAVSRVDIWFHVKGRSYRVATHRYSAPVTSLSDTFPWFSQSKWQGGDLELVFQGVDGTRISRYIPEDQIQRKSLEIPYDGGPMRVYEPTVQEGIGPDKYAWRHAGYDDESTFYYPFPLYPPPGVPLGTAMGLCRIMGVWKLGSHSQRGVLCSEGGGVEPDRGP